MASVQTAHCVAFCSKCARVHCSEIHRSSIFPKHVTTPMHPTKPAKRRARSATTTSQGTQGHGPFLVRPRPPVFSSYGSLCSPAVSLGCRLWRVSRCDWNTEPHSETKATGQKEERRIYTMFISLLYVRIYSLTPSWFRNWVSSPVNRTVKCLQSRMVFFRRKPAGHSSS